DRCCRMLSRMRRQGDRASRRECAGGAGREQPYNDRQRRQRHAAGRALGRGRGSHEGRFQFLPGSWILSCLKRAKLSPPVGNDLVTTKELLVRKRQKWAKFSPLAMSSPA